LPPADSRTHWKIFTSPHHLLQLFHWQGQVKHNQAGLTSAAEFAIAAGGSAIRHHCSPVGGSTMGVRRTSVGLQLDYLDRAQLAATNHYQAGVLQTRPVKSLLEPTV
jgi:hypothetical protein